MKSCFIDVHCHLDMCENKEMCIKNSQDVRVKIIITQGVNKETNRKSLELAKRYKEVKSALGIYPIDALSLSDKEIDSEIDFIRENNKNIIAIGEVGLDFKEDLTNHAKQKENFNKFIKLALELDKPIIVHSRKAEKECIEILENEGIKKVIMHCFCGKFSLVERISANGWFLSIPALIKNSQQFQNIANKIDIGRLLCETDSPYLNPDKSESNEPANVIEIYKKIAEIKKIKIEKVRDILYNNYISLFEK